MIVEIKKNQDLKQIENLKNWIKGLGLDIRTSISDGKLLLGIVGDTKRVDIDLVSSLDIVENVVKVGDSFKSANRKFHPENTLIDVAGHTFGGDNFNVIAGPCSVESEAQIISIAESVKQAGATFLRGGAFKPRTSPYAFQGLGIKGLSLLLKAKQETGMPIVTEIMNEHFIDDFADVDIIQVGARNMQNFDLLKKLGQIDKPILLKRGMSATINEWLMSAEYIMSEGNSNIILCERGIRTYETRTRNTLDLSAVPILKELTHLPIIVDPSHATGLSRLVKPMSLASVAVGAHGLIIEVHNNPKCALCDGEQSIEPQEFAQIMQDITRLREAL